MIDPQDIDPDTGRPYANYSSPALDTSFHDHEMDIDLKLATEADLIKIYGENGCHEDYTIDSWVDSWVDCVGEGDTRLGYWAWVAEQIEADC